MSELREAFTRWSAWLNVSPWRAGTAVLLVLLYLGGIALASYFWSRSLLEDFVAAGHPLDDGVLWARIFLAITIPALVMSAVIVLFAATQKWWSLLLLAVSTAPMLFFILVNPTGVIAKRHRIQREREVLLQLTDDPHLAEVVRTSIEGGNALAVVLLLLTIVWVLTRQRRRRFADPSTRHRADNSHLRGERFELAVRVFVWVYPFLAIAAIPLFALAGAANAS